MKRKKEIITIVIILLITIIISTGICFWIIHSNSVKEEKAAAQRDKDMNERDTAELVPEEKVTEESEDATETIIPPVEDVVNGGVDSEGEVFLDVRDVERNPLPEVVESEIIRVSN